MNKLQQTAVGGGKLLSLAALVTIVLGCAAPAHADSISVDLDTTAVTLQRSGNLYKHNSSVSVHNSNDYGFTLNLNTDQPDLVNSEDSTYRINSVTGYYKYLAANQWGYGAGSDATSFNPVSNATLADVTKNNNGDCYSISDCTIKLTFGANIDSKRLPVGSYSTSLTYTATSKPAPDWSSICSDRYSGSDAETSGKRSYCIQHQGNMGGYQPDWNAICRDRYYSDYNKQSYCVSHQGDMSDYRVDWVAICRDRYYGDNHKRAYCVTHQGDMSGYQPDWSSICYDRYHGSSMESTDKEQYCESHQGDMSGYQPDWSHICLDRYHGSDDESYQKNRYCESHQGDMSGYRYDGSYICAEKYPGTDPTTLNKFNYCLAHNGDMSGYNPYNPYNPYDPYNPYNP